MPLGRRRRGRRTPTRRSRPSPRSSTPPSADEESSDGAPSESDGDDEEGTAPTGRHRAGGALLRLLVLAGVLLSSRCSSQGLKGTSGRRTTREVQPPAAGRGHGGEGADEEWRRRSTSRRRTPSTRLFCRSAFTRADSPLADGNVLWNVSASTAAKSGNKSNGSIGLDSIARSTIWPTGDESLCFTLGAFSCSKGCWVFLTVTSKVECALQVGFCLPTRLCRR